MNRLVQKVILMSLIVACVACSTAPDLEGRVVEDKYFSPFGGLQCNMLTLPFSLYDISEDFEEHFGTVRMTTEMDNFSIDMLKLDPIISREIATPSVLETLYKDYYKNELLPNMESVYKQKLTSLHRVVQSEKKRVILFDVVEIPNEDVYRATIVYTNGAFIYTFTAIFPLLANPQSTQKSRIETAYVKTADWFNQCSIDITNI